MYGITELESLKEPQAIIKQPGFTSPTNLSTMTADSDAIHLQDRESQITPLTQVYKGRQ